MIRGAPRNRASSVEVEPRPARVPRSRPRMGRPRFASAAAAAADRCRLPRFERTPRTTLRAKGGVHTLRARAAKRSRGSKNFVAAESCSHNRSSCSCRILTTPSCRLIAHSSKSVARSSSESPSRRRMRSHSFPSFSASRRNSSMPRITAGPSGCSMAVTTGREAPMQGSRRGRRVSPF